MCRVTWEVVKEGALSRSEPRNLNHFLRRHQTRILSRLVCGPSAGEFIDGSIVLPNLKNLRFQSFICPDAGGSSHEQLLGDVETLVIFKKSIAAITSHTSMAPE